MVSEPPKWSTNFIKILLNINQYEKGVLNMYQIHYSNILEHKSLHTFKKVQCFVVSHFFFTKKMLIIGTRFSKLINCFKLFPNKFGIEGFKGNGEFFKLFFKSCICLINTYTLLWMFNIFVYRKKSKLIVKNCDFSHCKTEKIAWITS